MPQDLTPVNTLLMNCFLFMFSYHAFGRSTRFWGLVDDLTRPCLAYGIFWGTPIIAILVIESVGKLVTIGAN